MVVLGDELLWGQSQHTEESGGRADGGRAEHHADVTATATIRGDVGQLDFPDRGVKRRHDDPTSVVDGEHHGARSGSWGAPDRLQSPSGVDDQSVRPRCLRPFHQNGVRG